MLPVYDLVFAKICDVIKKIHFQVSKNILLLDKKKKKNLLQIGYFITKNGENPYKYGGKIPQETTKSNIGHWDHSPFS